jgi:RNA polymerase sigma-70 factor (ECF subfamily)
MAATKLEAIIAKAYSEGRDRFGDLGLDLPIFAKRIDSIIRKYLGESPSMAAIIGFVKGLHCSDLYLASACALYSPGGPKPNAISSADETGSLAWKVFETTYKGYIRSLARFFHRGGFIADDVADNILADLFLPEHSGVSRIASYSGRSSLSTWLRVIVCNRAINALRSSHVTQNLEMPPDPADEVSLNTVELALRAQRYGPMLEDSFAAACQTLTPHQRLILLCRYEQGLQLGQIGRLLGIHQSNVTRQLERLQSRLRSEVIAILSSKHGLSPLAIQECFSDIVNNPVHSLSILDVIKNVKSKPEKNSWQTGFADSSG